MGHELPGIGKISPEIFDELIYPHLGKRLKTVLVGPRHGVDIGVVDLSHGQVMATTTDPVFIVPEYGFHRAAWFAIHILCSDAVTSALPLKYLSIDLNLPLKITKAELTEMWNTIDAECRKMGIAIVSGHTARYQGCDYPMVGGATVIAIGPKNRYVTPGMARPGDVVILTKGAAIEATGLFAVTFPQLVAEKFGEDFSRKAQEIFWKMSVVEDAITAASVGTRKNGVTAMHDATECGVWGGLYEVAQASGVGMRVEKDKIAVLDEVEKICSHFGMDPYSSISEGTLIITAVPKKAEKIVVALKRKKIDAAIIGEVTHKRLGMMVKEDGREHRLEHPRVDPFWEAFGKILAKVQGRS